MKVTKKATKSGKTLKSNPKSKQKNVKTPLKNSKKAPVRKRNSVEAVKTPKILTPKAPFKQSEFFATLAAQVSLSKKEVATVVEGIKAIVKAHLIKSGPGQVTIPGLFKITSVTKPATKARKGRNPFTGEEMTFKAKPAKKVIKVKTLKKFKSELE